MMMLNAVAEPCYPDLPSGHEPPPLVDKPTTAPEKELPVDETPPATTAPPTGPITQEPLDAREKCDGRRHAERITKALDGITNATPAQIRQALNDLGYINERIYGLKQAGATTRFFIDLRVMGGTVCLEGSVTGSQIDVEAFRHPEAGPFSPAGRK